MEHTWRWFGRSDPITLTEIKQTGATGIVTALHHIPNGKVWEIKDILERKKLIEKAGLTWSVIESVPVHEDIKKHTGNYLSYIENYKQTLHNIGIAGIKTVCYNFMPILDWTRTDVEWTFPDGSKALKFDMKAFAAFDIFILKRPGAKESYTPFILKEAKTYFSSLTKKKIKELENTILLGLPGSEEKYELAEFKSILNQYKNINAINLKQNLFYFLKEIIPVAEKSGVKMAIHPDDPPRPLLGLPRVVSTLEDIYELTSVVDSPSNGITLCTGSLGAIHLNNVVEIASRVIKKVNFVHLRNVFRDEDGNFYEDNHLDGSIDMYEVIKIILKEEKRRKTMGIKEPLIPMRPDHGHQMLDDLKKKNYPGYSLIGRMKGLAEIRGLELGIRKRNAEC